MTQISLQDLNQLRVWIESKPNVPEDRVQRLWLVQAVRGAIPENVSSVGASCYRTETLVQFHLSALSADYISSDDRCVKEYASTWVVSHGVDFSSCEWCFNRVTQLFLARSFYSFVMVP